ncbi:MAG: DctP family TRAP transporter solute-binding subunit [Planctomycetes bacterium]|nr:DctP family TRAP transporter solute-binding subunit [Planctomycetota bacterium]
MTSWRPKLMLATLLALVLAMSGCGDGAGEGRRIRLSLILGDSSEWFKGAVKWKQLVEARTNGRYTVQVIPNATRSGRNQTTELQTVQQGDLEASLESSILLSTLDPRWTVFCYPWLFPDHATANAVCDGPVGEEMLDSLREKNLVGLAYGANGFRQITNNQHPIRLPSDLKGLRIRIPQGLPPELFRPFEATTHQMNFGDLYLALERSELHGQENPLPVIFAAKLYTVQRHLTICDFVYDPIVLCVNRDLWYTLSGADQKLLRECAREAMKFQRQLVAEADRVLPNKLEAEGMRVVRLTEVERDAFKLAAQPVLRPFFEKTAGKELLDRFEKAVKDAIEKAKAPPDDEEAPQKP